MDQLKLAALDEEDLRIVSAHVQDAVMKAGDLEFWDGPKLFVMPLYRFAWEKAAGADRPERRNAVLQFDRVTAVKASGVSRDRPDDVLSLLAIAFQPGEEPAGTVELVFSGGAAIRLTVECIEVRLTDLGGAWEASSRPNHET